MQAKHIISKAVTGLMALSLVMPAGVMAETGAPNDSVIDNTKTGKVTIHKIVENNGNNAVADGHDVLGFGKTDANTDHAVKEKKNGSIGVTDPFAADKGETAFNGTQDYDKDPATEKTEYDANKTAGDNLVGTGDEGHDGVVAIKDDSYLPVDGIVFSYKKVADITNANGKLADGTAIVGTYYTNLDPAVFTTIREALGVEAPKATMIDGKAYYTAEAVEQCITNMNMRKDGSGVSGEELIRQHIKENGEAMDRTNANGVSEKDGMHLGLYLFGETDIAAHDGLDEQGKQYVVEDYTLNPEYPVIESEAAPFLVSLPTTNVSKVNDNAAGTVWEYDLHVYPKDQTNSIVKRIVDPDDEGDCELRTREDFQVGDKIKQVIYADAPVLQSYILPDANKQVKQHEKFVIKDTMSKSLTFDGVSSVKIVPKAVNPQYDTDFGAGTELEYGKHYFIMQNGVKVEDPDTELGQKFTADHTFEVVLTDRETAKGLEANDKTGLELLDAIAKDSQVVVFFETTLNEKAEIGPGNANANYPNLTWKNSNTAAEKSVDGNRIYVYTYELDLKKTGVDDASKVIFTVERTDDNDRTVAKGEQNTNTFLYDNASQVAKEAVKKTYRFGDKDINIAFVQERDENNNVIEGVYHVFDPEHDAETDMFKVEVNGATYTNAVQPSKDGKLVIKGFDSDTYTFKEISTETGRNLLKSTFDIEFVEDGDPVMKYNENEGSAEKLQDGALIRATLSMDEGLTGGEASIGSADLNLAENNKGVAQVQVENNKTITLRTGGEGTTAIYASGAVMLGLLSVAVVAEKKRRMAQ